MLAVGFQSRWNPCHVVPPILTSITLLPLLSMMNCLIICSLTLENGLGVISKNMSSSPASTLVFPCMYVQSFVISRAWPKVVCRTKSNGIGCGRPEQHAESIACLVCGELKRFQKHLSASALSAPLLSYPLIEVNVPYFTNDSCFLKPSDVQHCKCLHESRDPSILLDS